MTLVAILIVRRRALEQFRAFERHAAALMAAHGGRIERTVVTPVADAPDLLREIHVVTFPDASAFQAYRDDARLGERTCARRRSSARRFSSARTALTMASRRPPGRKMTSKTTGTETGASPAGEMS
jgi:hypothetical protein